MLLLFLHHTHIGNGTVDHSPSSSTILLALLAFYFHIIASDPALILCLEFIILPGCCCESCIIFVVCDFCLHILVHVCVCAYVDFQAYQSSKWNHCGIITLLFMYLTHALPGLL